MIAKEKIKLAKRPSCKQGTRARDCVEAKTFSHTHTLTTRNRLWVLTSILSCVTPSFGVAEDLSGLARGQQPREGSAALAKGLKWKTMVRR